MPTKLKELTVFFPEKTYLEIRKYAEQNSRSMVNQIRHDIKESVRHDFPNL